MTEEREPQEEPQTPDKLRESLEKLMTKIQRAVEEIVTLKVVTVVGNVTLDDPSKPEGELAVDDSHVMKTEIDLLQGDIVSVVDKWYLQAANKTMRDQHEKREAQGQDTIRKNLATLKELATYVQELLDQD